MKTPILLTLLALGSAAQAQQAPAQPTSPAPTESVPFFRDVPRDHWAFAAVQRLAGAGIIEGVGTSATPQKITGSLAPRVAVTPLAVPAAKKPVSSPVTRKKSTGFTNSGASRSVR